MKEYPKNKIRSKNTKRLIYGVFVLICIILYLLSTKTEKKEETVPPDVVRENEYSYVHFLDVGQGDCTLIETHDGKFALIDASTQDSSDKIIAYLNNEGVTELEYVIFTHPHEDHIGGGDEVIENFKVNNVYMTNKTENTACYENLVSSLIQSKNTNGTKVLMPKQFEVFYLGDIKFLILSDGTSYDDTNNSSICFRMDLGKTTFLFTGDAEKTVENDIMTYVEDLDAEIYKCAHHGSSTSNGRKFLDRINPDVAIISCGDGNMYGHPHVEVLEDLYTRNILTLRTDRDGDIVIAFDKESFIKPSH